MRAWKVLGLAGLADDEAGAVVARDERRRRTDTPAAVRSRLLDRLARGGAAPAPTGDAAPVPSASTLTLAQAVELTRTGDLWIFRGRSPAVHFIRAFTNAPVNHVGMAVVLEDLPPLMWHAELGRSLTDSWSGTHHRGVQCRSLARSSSGWPNTSPAAPQRRGASRGPRTTCSRRPMRTAPPGPASRADRDSGRDHRGLPPTLRLHDLRHSCASWLISLRADPKVIQEWLGHASITVTMDVWTSVPVARRDARRKAPLTCSSEGASSAVPRSIATRSWVSSPSSTASHTGCSS